MIATRIGFRAAAAFRRHAASRIARRAFTVPHGAPVVSFSFDDFPRAALEIGGPILHRRGIRATYYASIGIAGQTTEVGEIFQLADLRHAADAGHELGCHTFDHCPAWETRPDAFLASVSRNASALAEQVGGRFRTLSYPISYPRPETKRRLGRIFSCCRGGGQTFNHAKVDLNYLKAFFLEQCGEDLAGIRALLAETCAAGGWLIFATHDVAPRPTKFGCTPEFFEAVVAAASESRATILPVHAALRELQSRQAQ